MKCPYTVDSEQYTQHTYTYNEEGQLMSDVCKLIEKRPYVNCLKDECAAWSATGPTGGECQYRASYSGG